MSQILEALTGRTLFGASLLNWALTLGLAVLLAGVLLAIKAALRRFYANAAQRTHRTGPHVIHALLQATRPFFVFGVSAYIADGILAMPSRVQPFFWHLIMLASLWQVGHWSMAIIGVLLERYRERNEGQRSTAIAALPGIRVIVSTVAWALIALVALDQFGVDVTALIAGLGIGGIAVALAVQKALGDLLAYVSIVADEPFQLGDFLNVDGYLGNVEAIGLRSTRVRSLGGEQIVFPNSDLLASRIRNFGRLHTRRVVFGFGVLYQTTPDQAQRIPEVVKEIIDALGEARFDRAHFKGYGDSSLDYEVVYYVLSPEYAKYMDIQQAINVELMRRFAAMGVEFAYPTRTLYVEESGGKTPADADGKAAPKAKPAVAQAARDAGPAGEGDAGDH